MIDITGKWALVTGASRGVGKRVAVALAEKGANVILHSRLKEGTRETAAAVEAAGRKAISLGAELSIESAVRGLVGAIEAMDVGLDILYNNAAAMCPSREVFALRPEDYRAIFEVNVIALITLCDALIPGMIDRGFGRIVNVTSGVADSPEIMPYSVSKAAVDRYVRDMVPSLEGTGVLMNLLDPGWLRTDMGGESAPNDPDAVISGALVPVLVDDSAGSGKLYSALDYRDD
jgi:NAD(P)-dependent dehydrogenase (short-subunit alcohol dehydrogenase family)